MLNPEVWITGGTTMAVGMGIVFSFLVILVFAMLIMSSVVGWLNKICPVATPVRIKFFSAMVLRWVSP